MIGRIYRLMDTKRIEMIQREVEFGSDEVLVRPDFLSICAADKRYYFGKRSREILNKKLPMALIHEATATVLYDASGELSRGSKVVMIPLVETDNNPEIRSNYNPQNMFMSSGIDGFMRDILAIPHCRLVSLDNDYSQVYVFSELVSVVINAVEAFEETRITQTNSIGIWGDGSMGYAVSLVLRCLYPNSKIYIFGNTPRKLQRFSFATKTFLTESIPDNLQINHCFECVGGKSSSDAIDQMLSIISSQGCICLLGVSEDPVSIRTRTVLDKGIKLIGNSRSNAEDMKKAVQLIKENSICRKYLKILVSELIIVKNEEDMAHAFEQSSLNDFKTVIKWEI